MNQRAWGERMKGNTARIGKDRMEINGNMWIWDDKKEELNEVCKKRESWITRGGRKVSKRKRRRQRGIGVSTIEGRERKKDKKERKGKGKKKGVSVAF